MKLRGLVFLLCIVCIALWLQALRPRTATAGGLLLPGAGAVSTSRAGAAVASADDGEAVVLNPAGIAKAEGTTITLSTAMIDYAMQFTRRGTYDAVPGETYSYAGQPYNVVKNDPSPRFGIGSLQPVSVVAVISDLGGKVLGGRLHIGFGIYAPNAYPFRDMCVESSDGCRHFAFDPTVPSAITFDATRPPASTRYDIIKQEVSVFLPSLVAAYRVLPQLDVGLRLSAGIAQQRSTAALWGSAGPNYSENIKADGVISLDTTDSFVPGWGLGATFRPTPNLEFAAAYNSQLDIHSRGTAQSQLGPSAGIPGVPTTIVAKDDADATCEKGGTAMLLKACGDAAAPRNAQLGGRYKFLDAAGKLKGDIELDLDWENWSGTCSEADVVNGHCISPSDSRIVVDAAVSIAGLGNINLKDGIIRHGFQDTIGIRAGGSYHVAIGAPREDGNRNELILRGGLGYDSAAAKTGWLRTDIDGAARTTITLGAAYRMRRLEISAGGGAILEGSPSNPNVGGGTQPCNPTMADPTCNGSMTRQGPDPINPIFEADNQALNPVNQGDYKAHYLLFMLGVTAWF
jgi:long-subunit fatty acid transport protein